MKKMILTAATCLLLVGCGMTGTGNTGSGSTGSTSSGSILGSIFGSGNSGETVGNIITSVLGYDKLTRKQLIGTWHYNGPGCAFTSDNALAKAGGEVAATQVEEKLKVQYDRIGISSSNTMASFAEDGTFTAKIAGKSWSGKWTLDEQTGAIKLSGLLINLNGYVKRNGTGISLLFESKKLLTVLQALAAISGNQTIEAVGEISKNYDGVRIGFDMSR